MKPLLLEDASESSEVRGAKVQPKKVKYEQQS